MAAAELLHGSSRTDMGQQQGVISTPQAQETGILHQQQQKLVTEQFGNWGAGSTDMGDAYSAAAAAAAAAAAGLPSAYGSSPLSRATTLTTHQLLQQQQQQAAVAAAVARSSSMDLGMLAAAQAAAGMQRQQQQQQHYMAGSNGWGRTPEEPPGRIFGAVYDMKRCATFCADEMTLQEDMLVRQLPLFWQLVCALCTYTVGIVYQ
jgi:hypothetical protein